ncbi:ArsC/Spx/MgsR family protein [Poseidonocella sp. HB161398]|uniref:ArsC/Spx/MgsR family protein n=1 Tax=Poseidonocella sp. HB161398 TaxID=2320855 RepID=UPI001107D3C7|nr:ArsC/Spx/MgsR family protein [Poseidonocella sp. HB161398]
MSIVTFYEKPGCISNTRQKQLLKASGHLLKVRSLLEHPWTPEELRPFFGSLPVAAWFNPTAPAVKSGRIRPATLDEAQALALLCADPILIRRPLIEAEGRRGAGFDAAGIHAWIGLADPGTEVDDRCASGG